MRNNETKSPGITLRAILIALFLMPFNALWIVHMEIVHYSGHPTTISLFFNVIFILLFLILLNLGLRRLSPNWALSPAELLVIYVMLCLASALCGHDMIQVLQGIIAHPFYYASAENKWANLFHKYIPRWLVPSDKAMLEGYFRGNSSIYLSEHWRHWAIPVLAWSGFIMVLLFIMMCMNVIIRKQWTEHEKLDYPIIQLPFEITRGSAEIFKNRYMWIAFGLAAIIDVLNGLNYLYPLIPGIPVRKYSLDEYVTQRPWNAIGWTPLGFFPFAIGFGYLLPLDLSFSCWFFFWFWKIQAIITSAAGWGEYRPGFPYINQQSFAGYMGICLFALWTSRRYLKEVFKKAIGLASKADDSREPMSYRTAWAGLFLGLAILLFFCLKAGMSIKVFFIYFAIYFAITVAVTRIRAELGSPAHDLHFAGPDETMVMAVGSDKINPYNLTVFSMFFWFNRAYRSHPMPHQLEAFKIAERTKMDMYKLMLVMMFAGLAGTFTAFWAHLYTYYRVGVASAKVIGPGMWFGWEPWQRLQGWLTVRTPPNYPALIAIGSGLVFTIFLQVMRTRFLWFPFHPVGYAISSSWSMALLWCPLFVAWLIKLLILRYGGIKLYRSTLPFFLGLILGDFVFGCGWTIIGAIWGIHTYQFWGGFG